MGFFNAPPPGTDPHLLAAGVRAWSPVINLRLIYESRPPSTPLAVELLEKSQKTLEYTIVRTVMVGRRKTKNGQGAVEKERARDPFMPILLEVCESYFKANPDMRRSLGKLGLTEGTVTLGFCKWKSDGLFDSA